MTRALAIGKRAHSLSTFVIICEKEIIQAFMAEGFKKPFAVIHIPDFTSSLCYETKADLHVGPRELI